MPRMQKLQNAGLILYKQLVVFDNDGEVGNLFEFEKKWPPSWRKLGGERGKMNKPTVLF